jgi:FkbM family methyltransferase
MQKNKFKRIKYIFKKYNTFKSNPLTAHFPIYYFAKYIYANSILYIFKSELSFTFLNNIKVKAKRGDGIIGNYHSVLQEPIDSVFLLKYLQPGDTFLDIGANVGHYSLIASAYSKCKVIAIEPIPNTYTQLINNLERNQLQHKVNALNIGLGDKNGKLFFTNSQFTTNKVSKDNTGIEVAVKTADQITQDHTINAVKIDVEGYEWFVLKGAKQLLQSSSLNIIIIELNESGKYFSISDEQIVALLNENGFNQYEYDIANNSLIPLEHKNKKQFNTVFVKNIQQATQRLQQSNSLKIGKKVF